MTQFTIIVFATFINIIFASDDKAYNIYNDVAQCRSINKLDSSYACARWKEAMKNKNIRHVICKDISLEGDKIGYSCSPSWLKKDGYTTYISYNTSPDNKLIVSIDHKGPSEYEIKVNAFLVLTIVISICACACICPPPPPDINDSNSDFATGAAFAWLMSDSYDDDGYGGWDVHEKYD